MSKRYLWVALPLLGLLGGCATSLNPVQEAELDHYRAKNLLVEEKDPKLAAGLGLLPGGGSFYSQAYGAGVINLLLWPASILWDPVSGYGGAKVVNYYATKARVRDLRAAELEQLDSRLATNEIDLKRYTQEKRKVEDKYPTF